LQGKGTLRNEQIKSILRYGMEGCKRIVRIDGVEGLTFSSLEIMGLKNAGFLQQANTPQALLCSEIIRTMFNHDVFGRYACTFLVGNNFIEFASRLKIQHLPHTACPTIINFFHIEPPCTCVKEI
jgi:hypothetical protein